MSMNLHLTLIPPGELKATKKQFEVDLVQTPTDVTDSILSAKGSGPSTWHAAIPAGQAPWKVKGWDPYVTAYLDYVEDSFGVKSPAYQRIKRTMMDLRNGYISRGWEALWSKS